MPTSSASSRRAHSSGRLALDVELSRGQLEQVRSPTGLARLAHQVDVLVVVRDDRHRPRMGDDLALGLGAVLVAEGVDPDRRDRALVDDLRG